MSNGNPGITVHEVISEKYENKFKERKCPANNTCVR